MVDPAPRRPTAVLVASVWCDGAPPRLAARITYTLDVTGDDRVTVAAVGVEEIEAVVQRWLRRAEASVNGGDASVTEA